MVHHSLLATDKPTDEIVSIVKRVFEERHLDARFLIPILGSLNRSEVIRYLPNLMKLPKTAFEQVIQKLVHPAYDGPAPMDPTDLLFTIHVIDPSTEQVGLTKIKDAIQVCLDMKTVFKQEVLAGVIQRLVDHTPPPLLLMRTLIQTATQYPDLINFLNHTVTRLILKKIWTSPQLWEGFIKYCQLVKHHAAGIILQLPKSQALEVFMKAPSLRKELELYFATHATHQLYNKFYALFSESSIREKSLRPL
jgi:symplekin